MTLLGRRTVVMLFLMIALAAGVAVPPAHADNKRLNETVVVAVYGQPV
jgi:hypothetical protein